MVRRIQKIIVMGLSYIGLPTASMLASKGHQVVGVDENQPAMDIINSERIHIFVPSLFFLVCSVVDSGNPKVRDLSYVDSTILLLLLARTKFKDIELDTNKDKAVIATRGVLRCL